MIKKFIKENKGQALSETILFFALVGMIIMIFLIQLGFIQIIRMRLSMANRFMVYTATHAKNPDAGRQLEEKVRLMLENGPPIISNKKKYFKNLSIRYKEKTVSIKGIKLPFGPKKVVGQVSVDYYFRSRIMRKILGKKKMRLRSDKIAMYKDSLYKGIISFSKLRKFFGYKKRKAD